MALFCLKTVCEVLGRLLLKVFLEEKDISISPESLLEIIKTCNRQNLTLVLQDESIIAIIQEYLDFQDKVRKGHLGKTAVFWLSVMDHQRLVFMLIYVVKASNRMLYHVINGDGEMAELFLAFDNKIIPGDYI